MSLLDLSDSVGLILWARADVLPDGGTYPEVLGAIVRGEFPAREAAALIFRFAVLSDSTNLGDERLRQARIQWGLRWPTWTENTLRFVHQMRRGRLPSAVSANWTWLLWMADIAQRVVDARGAAPAAASEPFDADALLGLLRSLVAHWPATDRHSIAAVLAEVAREAAAPGGSTS